MANVIDAQLSALLVELIALKHETEWVEFKQDYTPKEIGPYIAEYPSGASKFGGGHCTRRNRLPRPLGNRGRNTHRRRHQIPSPAKSSTGTRSSKTG